MNAMPSPATAFARAPCRTGLHPRIDRVHTMAETRAAAACRGSPPRPRVRRGLNGQAVAPGQVSRRRSAPCRSSRRRRARRRWPGRRRRSPLTRTDDCPDAASRAAAHDGAPAPWSAHPDQDRVQQPPLARRRQAAEVEQHDRVRERRAPHQRGDVVSANPDVRRVGRRDRRAPGFHVAPIIPAGPGVRGVLR